jgi:saccharopine dehydrogenase-like NADP-dependent oxidoreductase
LTAIFTMKKILVLGAGRSSADLIKYLLQHATAEQWRVRVGDLDLAHAQQKINNHSSGEAFQINGGDQAQLQKEVEQADMVISMLPAFMHIEVARICLQYSKNLITPSYVTDEMLALDQEARSKGVVFLNEMGVDPGIDHMSAMHIIHSLQEKGATLESFESFTGGLIAPESDNNPWNYKITWNPRNVVLAGSGGTARYWQNNTYKFIPYHQLFKRLTFVEVDGYGRFEGYANRDSMKYKSIYGLDNLPTIYRGTLRRDGFCKAWDALVQLGLTDDSFEITEPAKMTWADLTASFIEIKEGEDLVQNVKGYLNLDEVVMSKLQWLGIFDAEPLGMEKGTPAVALQKLIEKKWVLDEGDKDMTVMWHRFYYTLDGKRHELQSSMIVIGDDPVYTSMSKTVGLPMAIAARKILKGEMKLAGVHLPVTKDIYEPILSELATLGVAFEEKIIPC